MIYFCFTITISNITDKVQFINRCKEELSEEIESHKLKGLPTQIMVHMLFNCYKALLRDKAYCKEPKYIKEHDE